MDIKDLIKWSLKHWWWFVISVVVCVILGGVYYIMATPKYNVTATLMLRKTSSGRGGQDEMMQMMGFGGEKLASDEIKILSSRDLMGRVVDELNLGTIYLKKEGCGWKEQFPECDLKVAMQTPAEKTIVVDVKVQGNGYKVKVKTGVLSSQHFSLKNLAEPVHTELGDILLSMPLSVKEGHYRAVLTPRIKAIENQLNAITVSRLSRESNILNLTTLTRCPQRSITTVNTLLNFYNQESATDKNLLAIQTEQFLAERIEVVERELNEVELALETYKRTQQIADLSKTADNYQMLGDSYEQQVAEMDADLRVLDFLAEQIAKPENAYSMIPGNVGSKNANLNALIADYNNHIVHRNTLLQSATEQNLVVVQETQLLDQKRQSIEVGISQTRQTLDLKRQSIVDQQNQYASRLASIPETERRYLEMSRDKQTKEKQYLYLIEKREENAMLLASDAVPAKIVDRAQQDSKPAQPRLKVTGIVSLLLGLLIPFLFYGIELFRKEYL